MKITVTVACEGLYVGGEMQSMEEIKTPQEFFPRFGPFFRECIREMTRAKFAKPEPEPCCDEADEPEDEEAALEDAITAEEDRPRDEAVD